MQLVRLPLNSRDVCSADAKFLEILRFSFILSKKRTSSDRPVVPFEQTNASPSNSLNIQNLSTFLKNEPNSHTSEQIDIFIHKTFPLLIEDSNELPQ